MSGNAVFKMAVNTLDAIVDETLQANGLNKTDIDWLVPHQANITSSRPRRKNWA
jgi:3-oxoacyl-[acyl-carrier-protein] synthase-3